MFGSLGVPELAIIAGILVLLFGVGKLSGLGKDLGSSVKEFRRAIKDDDDKPAQSDQQPPQQYQATQAPPAEAPQQQQPVAPPQSTNNNHQARETEKPNVF